MRNSVDKVNQVSADTANDVFESIHSIMHIYRARQYQDLRDSPHEITHMEFKVLNFFARHPGATQSDLVMHSGRDKAQLARLIKGLGDKGLLEARVSESDRRSTCLQLSVDGKTVHKSLHRRGSQLSKVAVKGMNEQECGTLTSLLDRVRANLEAERDQR
jgi:DNA-binding MarR family transcriptional regulator